MEIGLVALWLALFLALGIVGLPIAAWVLPDGDHGAFAIPVALAVLGIVGHLVGHVAFPRPALVAGVLVLVAGSLLARRRVDPDHRSLVEASLVFVLAFLFVVGIRAVDPGAGPLPHWIGEKFLDFGLLSTLDRAGHLPPEDVWFAGESVRYYYGGHLVTTLLGTLSGTPPRFTYNLGLAGFYATLVTAAWGLAGSIATPMAVSRRAAAGLAAFFVGLAANLEPVVRVVVWALPDGLGARVVDGAGLDSSMTTWQPTDFYYFDASRVIPVDPTAADPFMAATEFPLFAWLNGDLHAHMTSQPFALLAAAILLAYWRTAEARVLRRRILLFGLLGPLAGFLALVNLWSFPTVGGLVALTILFAPADPATLLPGRRIPRPHGNRRIAALLTEGRRIALGVTVAAAVLAVGVLSTLPYWSGVVLGGPGQSVALWGIPTPLVPLLVVHGAFLAAFVPYLARRGRVAVDDPLAVGAIVGLVGVAVVLLGYPAFGVFGPLLAVGWWLLRRDRVAADDPADGDPDRITAGRLGFETVLVVAGIGLVLLVELVTVEGERFNTIFKPYAQVWLLWAVAAGVVLARLSRGWPGPALGLDADRWRTTGRILTAVLVVSTAIYAGMALPDHVDDGSAVADAEGPTLDATAYLEIQYPAEAEAIRWLADRDGQPSIVTAAPGGYYWNPEDGEGSAAPASLTGVPTVLGWHHERQYRGDEQYQERLTDVEAIYTGDPDRGRALLEQYDVTYVYVGPAERNRYDDLTVDQIEGLSVAAEFEEVRIYERSDGSG